MLQISDCDSVTVVTVVTRKNFHFPRKKTYFSFLWFTKFFKNKKKQKKKKNQIVMKLKISNFNKTQKLKL